MQILRCRPRPTESENLKWVQQALLYQALCTTSHTLGFENHYSLDQQHWYHLGALRNESLSDPGSLRSTDLHVSSAPIPSSTPQTALPVSSMTSGTESGGHFSGSAMDMVTTLPFSKHCPSWSSHQYLLLAGYVLCAGSFCPTACGPSPEALCAGAPRAWYWAPFSSPPTFSF